MKVTLQRIVLAVFILLLFAANLEANNITVSNISQTGQNTTDNFTLVQFDLSWEISWVASSAPGNWDATRVIVKRLMGIGDWQQALLSNIVQIEKDLLVYKFSNFYKAKS